MAQVHGLAATFLAHAKVRIVPSVDTTALEGLLVHAWETSRARWPAVELPSESFVTHIAERLPKEQPDSPLEPILAQLSLAELYLACACVRGLPAAIELLERNYLAKLPKLLRGPKLSEALLDDVCQLTRVKLLVTTPEGPPKLAEYAGRGALMSWVHVAATRFAIKLQGAEKPSSDEDMDDIEKMIPAPGLDAELDLMKRRYHADFRQAVNEAFRALSADERYLLRLYFVDQLSMYELAELFRVNQSTVSRWLKSARQSIYEETRHRLQERLGLSPRDFQSFLAMLDSKLELSISQLLGEAHGVPPAPKPD
ncbi:putative DNA-binding regulatory protein [Cystobacter fuscus DSM 2262]|uniref:DNA-binding regulatory protein n=1 Tax=Cystobacter fuscus (strain ATCC 25194 / DSM 2262 / NBRC 100088 / M29) TaxID=1242864 RepID=S9QUI2_CYSF2|nr:sigma-70 family RNA polymerase sigma factor [Cystobacter fuscus]EPX60308.1 putative DNA-binding regulatory protein [Cystobacter fuscus DSM 2262]